MNLDFIVKSTCFEHSRQVSQISSLLAKTAGYAPADISIIEQAALYHDIGKSAIPAEILNKPGALTPAEFALVKTHTDAGARQLLELANIFTIAGHIAREHHERCDGSGYMNLQGHELHPYSKVIAVADVFDALYSRRPYKDAWDVTKIRDFFEQQVSQFDAEIVHLLFSVMNHIQNLY